MEKSPRHNNRIQEERQPTEPPLFSIQTRWGQQPVRLTAWRCRRLPEDAPTTSVHIVAFHGDRVLVVRDRKGIHGFPGGRLEAQETCEQALERELHEEAQAHLKPDYRPFAVLKIEYLDRLPGRSYPHEYSYMAMYVGRVRALEPIKNDPAGIITARALFSCAECVLQLPEHDVILLREALAAFQKHRDCDPRPLRAFAMLKARAETPSETEPSRESDDD